MEHELKELQKYLLSESKETAKDHLVFPLFQKLFKDKFSKQTDAERADIYIEGQLVVELKSKTDDWVAGFYQALHYAKFELSFSSICVIAHKFIAVWKVKDIPAFAKKLYVDSDAQKSPNETGRINANKTSKAQRGEILRTAAFCVLPDDIEGLFAKEDILTELREFVQVLKNLDKNRIQIGPHNFIDKIKLLGKYFNRPMDPIHCFYSLVGFWTPTSKVAFDGNEEAVKLIDVMTSRFSEDIRVKPGMLFEFKKFVEDHYIFTNEGSGLTADYYFSRFDEVIAKLNPEYARQHGIFFTDNNLSKFALWFVHEYYEKKLSDKYIVFDPAGGSGNLVTSWKGHLKHKIVSELEPDLLKTIERRMKLDPEHVQTGFTIVPKTSEGVGLNFLDKNAEVYLYYLMQELGKKNLKLDKPLAFLLNPPYKNTDENETKRAGARANYAIHPSILELTGNDAGNERYLAFLGQIVNIARTQMGDLDLEQLEIDDVQLPKQLDPKKVETPLLMIFTPTSWLIPRPTYVPFRKEFDKYFKYEMGFIITGNEFFKIDGRFPISFTIWNYCYNTNGNKNKILLRDLTGIKHDDININWNKPLESINKNIKNIIGDANTINYSKKRLLYQDWVGQKMYDFKRSPTKKEKESNGVIGGLPLKDGRRNNIKTYGITDSTYVGFMDNASPVRIKHKVDGRFSQKHESKVWFRLDTVFINLNQTKIFSGPSDNRSYCAFDMKSAQKTFSWFALTKALNGVYPVWANQFDIWAPNISSDKEKYFYSLCFAFGLAENRCVVTKFEKDNPVPGAPEVFVDNPLCPANPESFWSTTLDGEITGRPKLALELVDLVKKLYSVWNNKYCKGQTIKAHELQDEPYFKHFDYSAFLTPHSGLIQIRKYAEMKNCEDLNGLFKEINEKSKEVKEEIYGLLVKEFKYFE
jgi:hypothetical protein